MLMVITRTPFRISFFGGGTDYPAWYKEHGGAVLATTINKYCHITCRHLPPFFDHKHRIVYSRAELVNSIEEIQHPSVRATLTWAGCEKGLEIHHDGDLPARAGLGSSSSFTVGLVNALKALEGKYISKEELAGCAIHIEQNVIKENVGSQDQVSASFGGLNCITFNRNDMFQVSPVTLGEARLQEFQSHLMLFFTGFTRFATDIAKEKIKNFKNRESELKQMREMVDESIQILQSNNTSIDSFGALLHESWKFKRQLSDKVSTPEIDAIFEEALSAGAISGKLLGAGGGGFVVFFVKPELQAQVRERLKRLVYVPFKFEFSGSRVMHYQPEDI
jgi:D-glycero-alpha-D-manno-heptose-7-phosphate kinase